MRRQTQLPAGAGRTVLGALYTIFRMDGSFFAKCEYYSERDDAWLLCRGSKKGQLLNGFANGVWTIEGNLLCGQMSTTKVKRCYAVFDDDGRIFLKSVGKNAGFSGYLEFLDETRLDCVGYLKSANC